MNTTTINQAAGAIAHELLAHEGRDMSSFIAIAEAVESTGELFKFKSDELKAFVDAIATAYEEESGAPFSKSYRSAIGYTVVGVSFGLNFELESFKLNSVAAFVLSQAREDKAFAKSSGYKAPARSATASKDAQKAGKVDGYAVPKTPAMRVMAFLELAKELHVTLSSAQMKKLEAVK